MAISTLTAATIEEWEKQVGPSPIHGEHIELRNNGLIEHHQHDRGQIMTAVSGVVSVSVNDRTFIVSGETGVWIPEGVFHHANALTKATLNNLQISRLIAPTLPLIPHSITVTLLFSALVGSAVSGEKWIRPGTRIAKIINLLTLEFSIAKEVMFWSPDPTDGRLAKICTALRANPADNRQLVEWANLVGASPRTIERLFYKQTGLTFSQWRQQVRLHDALIRLRRGQSVTSVALDVGYENISAFISMFRRMTGYTPNKLRQ